jgi:hypothetical protein
MEASAAEPSDDARYVLTLPAVRWGINTLKGTKVHPFFLAYLHLRKRSAEEGSDVVSAQWDELGELMRVPGGPPGKPYYRPFWHGNVDDPGRYWLNRNIAGSYAPSSLRNVPLKIVEIVGSEFRLRPHHAQLARQHLLLDQPLSAIALAAFFYRNFAFTVQPPAAPSPFDLPEVFREDFHFASQDDEEYAVLFDEGIPPEMDWFEPVADLDAEVWE